MSTITPLATPAGASQPHGAKPSDDTLSGRQPRPPQQQTQLLQINPLQGGGVTEPKRLDKTV